MGVNLGSTAISDLRLGDTQIGKAYLGSELVWNSAQSVIRALKFECAGAQTLGINQSYLGTLTPSFEYSNDGQMWNTWDITTSLSFGNGTDLYIRGMNTVLSIATNFVGFTFSQPDNKVTCTGNVMHLFDYTQDLTAFPADPDSHGITYLFTDCTALAVPPSLPAITLIPYCYAGTFQNCSSLTAIPALPATNLADQCYRYTFVNCSSIKMSTTQSAEYPNEYVFGADPSDYAFRMFWHTGGTFTGAPDQTTYYTANTIIS
jgi:hypothetical protein